MRNTHKGHLWKGTIILMLLLFCFAAGCNNGSQNNAVPLSSSGTGGSISTTGAVVKGTVVDDDSLVPLKGASVSIGSCSATTDADGNYSLSGVSSGTQTMKVILQNYEDITEQITVTEGQTTTMDIGMFTTNDDWLDKDTTYNWQVEAVQADGTVTSGPQWSFTTEASKSARMVTVTDAIDEEQARKVAAAFLEANNPGSTAIGSMEIITNRAGITLAYAFVLSPTGYIIVPASRADTLPPVLAYSFTSAFSAHRVSSLFLTSMVRNDISLRLAAVNEKAPVSRSVTAKNKNLWDSYLAGKTVGASSSRATTGPLLYTPTWKQSCPYNDNCPMDPKSEDRCITGCVATAYSQILNYWQYPTTVAFTSANDYTTDTRKIAISASSANFSGISYNSGYPGDTVKAQICFALGVLAEMDYTSTNSSAYTLQVGKALTKFGYSQPRTKSFGNNDTLDTSTIITDLQASPYGRPVAMAITQVNENGKRVGGHAIVCDGYSDTYGTFHLNMGWGGSSNGWYTLPSGMPSNYSVVKGYVYNLTPSYKSTSSKARSAEPSNPWPDNGDTDIMADEELLWDECDNAVSYNCYLWKASGQKPSTPTFSNLPYAAANPSFKETD